MARGGTIYAVVELVAVDNLDSGINRAAGGIGGSVVVRGAVLVEAATLKAEPMKKNFTVTISEAFAIATCYSLAELWFGRRNGDQP